MMNPPEAFVQAALAAQPIPPVNNPIVFDQAGQAVMFPPPSAPPLSPQVDTAPPVQFAPVAPVQVPVAPEHSDTPSASPHTATRTVEPTAAPTDTPDAQVSTDAATMSQSVMEMVTSQTMTDSQASSAIASTTASQSADTTSTGPSTSLASTATHTSATHAVSSSVVITASSAASAAATDEAKPFTQTTGFIFLMVLGGLVLVAVVATLCSTFMRWRDACGCLPCCRPERDDEEDGLSDLVRSFDHDRPPTTMASLSRVTSTRSSTYRQQGEMAMSTSQNASIERRASLLATSPAQAAFLHSANHVDGDGSVFGGSNAGKYFVGGPGPLRVKNAVEGDMQSEAGVETVLDNQHVAGPRHLGVEGNGLTVPWPTTQPSRTFTASSYASSRYGGPPFPSPPVTIEEQQDSNQAQQQQPTRASTWASNLRTTLFTAISANRAAEEHDDADAGDRYTRSVLPLHRGSTRRSTRSTIPSAIPVTRRSYPLVIDEKDEQELDRVEADAGATTGIGSRFLMDRGATNQSLTSSVGTALGGIGERYKSWSRSQRSAETEAWVKPVLAGGERARGITNRP